MTEKASHDADTVATSWHQRELDVSSSEVPLLAGRYRILGMLGRGGMGTVYRVRDETLDEVVALKTLRHDWIRAPGALARFRREVKLARRVTHPNVARTFDIGEHEGEPFLTMELIDGTSLGSELADVGRLPVERAVRIAVAIASALGAAHAVGVVHRDLKPDNVLLGRDGRVVITDFGIARVETADDGATAAGALVGTPAYMSPEQVQALPADARSDLYALGLVLYEMLTGHRAFDGAASIVVAAARVLRPPPDPREHAPALSPPLADLTLQLLAREPAERPSVAQVLAVLGRVEAGDASSSAPRALAPAEASRTVAAFPLRSVGPPEDHWIADGLTDDMFDALCTIRGLRMKARSAILPGEAPHDYARRLGVELLLEGSVRRLGDRVRLVLRLITVEDGFQVWAERIDCAMGDLLMISDRVAGAVAEAVGRSLPAGPPRAPVPREALDLYLRARDVQRRLAFGWREAAQLLERAHAIAPDDPTIAACYADVLVNGFFEAEDASQDRLATARAAAERALDLAPHLAEPWFATARVRYNAGDTSGASRALRRALANGPGWAPAHDLVGRILTELDRPAQATRFLERALAIDPSLGFATTDLIRIATFAGDWERALALHAGLAGAPEFALMAGLRLALYGRLPADGLWLHLGEAAADRLLAVVRKATEGGALDEEDRVAMWSLDAAWPPVSRPTRFAHQLAAETFLRVGEVDHALAAVRRSVDAGLEDLAWLRHCPLLAPLHAAGALAEPLAIVERRADVIGRAWDQETDATPTR